MRRTIIFTLCVLMLSSLAAYADTIELKDGSVIKGKITKIHEHSMEIQSSAGLLTIEQGLIKEAAIEALPQSAPGTPVSAVGEDDSIIRTGDSIYTKRSWGLGFTAGISSGSGLSAIYTTSPISYTLTAFIINDGISVGSQIQYDIIHSGNKRFLSYLGASFYGDQNYPFVSCGFGLGFGWMASTFMGFTIDGGLRSSFYQPDTDEWDIDWGPDVNFMLHFYVK